MSLIMDWNSTNLPWQNTNLPWKNTSMPWNDTDLPWKAGGTPGGGEVGAGESLGLLLALTKDS